MQGERSKVLLVNTHYRKLFLSLLVVRIQRTCENRACGLDQLSVLAAENSSNRSPLEYQPLLTERCIGLSRPQ